MGAFLSTMLAVASKEELENKCIDGFDMEACLAALVISYLESKEEDKKEGSMGIS